VLVVQIKPQLEKILNLPADSLTKEIKLNQDLMELFITYQIPSDLLSYDTSSLPGGGGLGSDVVSVRDKLQAVKDHVAAIHEMIGATKKQELAQRLEEVQYSMECVDDFSATLEVDMLCNSMAQPPSMVKNKKMSKGSAPRAMARGSSRSGGLVPGGGRGGGGGGLPLPCPPPAPCSISAPVPIANATTNHKGGSSNTAPSSTSISGQQSAQNHHDHQLQKVQESVTVDRPFDDCTVLPDALNKKFDQLDKDGAVRPVILTVGKSWKKRSQKALLSAATTSTLQADEQKSERSAAFDLLDALSRSGGLTLDNTDLHVVLMSTHCFDKTLMNTIIQKNTNPIEKMEQSTLVMASVIHGKSAEELTEESQHERLHQHATMLFQE
jgi:hypothetical protein